MGVKVFMLLSSLLLFLPVIHSSLQDTFAVFDGYGAIRTMLFDYLEIKDSIRLMMTCKYFYKFYSDIEPEFDQIFEVFTGLKNSFSSIKSSELKAEIVLLWNYHRLEMDYRRSNDPFTLDTFYLMNINIFVENCPPSYFTNHAFNEIFRREN